MRLPISSLNRFWLRFFFPCALVHLKMMPLQFWQHIDAIKFDSIKRKWEKSFSMCIRIYECICVCVCEPRRREKSIVVIKSFRVQHLLLHRYKIMALRNESHFELGKMRHEFQFMVQFEKWLQIDFHATFRVQRSQRARNGSSENWIVNASWRTSYHNTFFPIFFFSSSSSSASFVAAFDYFELKTNRLRQNVLKICDIFMRNAFDRIDPKHCLCQQIVNGQFSHGNSLDKHVTEEARNIWNKEKRYHMWTTHSTFEDGKFITSKIEPKQNTSSNLMIFRNDCSIEKRNEKQFVFFEL